MGRTFAVIVAGTAALAVLIFAVYLYASSRPEQVAPIFASQAGAELLAQEIESASRRTNDLQILGVILLGASGLYSLVFVLYSQFSAQSLERRIEHSISGVKDDFNLPIGELRELQKRMSDAAEHQEKIAAELFTRIGEEAKKLAQEMCSEPAPQPAPVDTNMEHDLATIEKRLYELLSSDSNPSVRQEVQHYANALAGAELFGAQRAAPALAKTFRALAMYYQKQDPDMARFYMQRALSLTPGDCELANDLGVLAMKRISPEELEAAQKYFEASLALNPNQEKPRMYLAQIQSARGNLEESQNILSGFTDPPAGMTANRSNGSGEIHYVLARILGRRARKLPNERSELLRRALSELQIALAHPSKNIERQLARDIEPGGDLHDLTTISPFDEGLERLLLNLSLGG